MDVDLKVSKMTKKFAKKNTSKLFKNVNCGTHEDQKASLGHTKPFFPIWKKSLNVFSFTSLFPRLPYCGMVGDGSPIYVSTTSSVSFNP
jgi:hypothetical protein